MKIIIIKSFNKWKPNDIVNVADGYAKNFLIKKGYAVSFNESNINNRKKQLVDKEDKIKKLKSKAIILKSKIEDLKPIMYLRVDKNLIVHNSITRKKILDYLRKENISINNNRDIENIKIESLGISKIKINIYDDVYAFLTIDVRNKNEFK